MEGLFPDVSWDEVLLPSESPLELILRASLVFLVLYFVLRVVVKREVAGLGISDLLVVVLIADGVQNAMAGGYTSVFDGLIVAGTLIFWSWMLSFLAFRWRGARRVIRPAPLLLIRDGQIIAANLRRELISEDELLSELRLQGIERIEDVRYAFMEPEGQISVVPREPSQPRHKKRRRDIT